MDVEAVRKAGDALKHAAMLISIKSSGGAKPHIEDDLKRGVFHPPPAETAGFTAAVEAMLAAIPTR